MRTAHHCFKKTVRWETGGDGAQTSTFLLIYHPGLPADVGILSYLERLLHHRFAIQTRISSELFQPFHFHVQVARISETSASGNRLCPRISEDS